MSADSTRVTGGLQLSGLAWRWSWGGHQVIVDHVADRVHARDSGTACRVSGDGYAVVTLSATGS
jgi:hypothetical protein